MKHILFALIILASLAMIHSCNSEPSCKLEGQWKVESCDIQSSKLSPTVISMAKDEYLSSTYEFQKDGKFFIHLERDSKSTTEGTYTFDDNTQTLSWETVNINGTTGGESFQVNACTDSSISLTQRLPDDPAKEEIATVTLTLAKVQ